MYSVEVSIFEVEDDYDEIKSSRMFEDIDAAAIIEKHGFVISKPMKGISHKNVNRFSMTIEWGKEFTVDGIEFMPIQNPDKESCLIQIASKIDTDEIYLGETNDFTNDGWVGMTNVIVRIEHKYIGNTYKPYLHCVMAK